MPCDVAFGKTGKLSLTPIPLKSQVDAGERNFFAAAPDAEAQRASFLVNEVVRTTWHLKTVAARAAWATSLGSNAITIAVLDDGVDVDHPNLKGRIRRNPGPNEARDLCGRDFFVGESAPDHFNPRPKLFMAPFNKMRGNDIHGTPCAGVIAADGTKGGIRGVAPGCRILPVKVFHADELAIESQVADAIRYASTFADILSCSWSGPQSPDIESALRDAAQGRGGKGCPIFVATGNGHPAVGRVSYPASSDHVIAIGASTDGEDIAGYSQRGPEVAMVAPSTAGGAASRPPTSASRTAASTSAWPPTAASTACSPTASAAPRRQRRWLPGSGRWCFRSIRA